MEISEQALDNGAYKINLAGRMDVEGVGRIEMKFAGMSASPRMRIIVDLSSVSFMSSIGIRALLMNAKAVGRRDGKFVLLNPNPTVREVLTTAAIDQLIPVCAALDEALQKVAP